VATGGAHITVYKVTGTTPFLGHQPGDEFEAELDPEQERRAKERGSIRVVRRNNKEEEADA
jgi:hypothetical protein